jgi:hypothetical protein
MSKLPSVADYTEKWKEIVNTQPDVNQTGRKEIGKSTDRPEADANQTAWNPVDITERVTSPLESHLPPTSHSQPTVVEFLSNCCRSECGNLVNRILKKLLPSLRQTPSAYPLCFIQPPDSLSQHSGLVGYQIPGVTVEASPIFDASKLADSLSSSLNGIAKLDDIIVSSFQCLAPTPNRLPLATPPGVAVICHPVLPDFILEGIAHYLLQTVAIESFLEDQEKITTLHLTKDVCETIIRTLAVASIYFAGKVRQTTFFFLMIGHRLSLQVVIWISNPWLNLLRNFLFKLLSHSHQLPLRLPIPSPLREIGANHHRHLETPQRLVNKMMTRSRSSKRVCLSKSASLFTLHMTSMMLVFRSEYVLSVSLTSSSSYHSLL